MKWEDVCLAFPEQWILIEAIQVHTHSEHILKEIASLKKFSNSPEAMRDIKKFIVKIQAESYMFYTLASNRIGAMNYGFDLDGVIGLDLLQLLKATINMDELILNSNR